MAVKPPMPVAVGVPQSVCPSCKAPNEPGTVLCKRCGDILPAKKSAGKGGKTEEYDATAGTMHPGCIIAPLAICAVVALILFISFRGPKAGTCEWNREHIGIAISKWDRAHKDQRMSTLDLELLLKPDNKGKSYLKDRPVCPIDSTAAYSLSPEGKVICSHAGRKR